MPITFPIMDHEIIGRWVRDHREAQGFTSQEVSARLRISKDRYQKIENGAVPVTIHFFAKFLLLFEIESIDFLGVELDLHSNEPVPSFNKLGNQIQVWREETGYSLRSLAEQICISHTALRNLENGTKRVMLLTLIRLDDALEKKGALFSVYLQKAIHEVSGKKNKFAQIMVGEARIQIPSDMPDLTSRSSYWQHKLAPILWCIGVKGRSTAQDVGLLMGEEYQILNSALNRLEKLHLIESFRSYLLGPIKLFHLSDMGELFCKELGWAVKKSDLEVLFDGHQGRGQLRHTAALLFFAYKARSSGYTVTLLPSVGDVESRYQPDVLISNEVDSIYFEVELSAKNKSDKWKNQVDQQGFVAFFTINDTCRNEIEQQIRNCGVERVKANDCRFSHII